MKKLSLLLLTSILATGWIVQGEAAVVLIGGPEIVLTNRQPVQAVVVDTNGNTYQQTVYYDPAIGGVDLDTSWAGPNASVYFPDYGTGYLWYNGYWVDRAGFYWNGGQRVYIGHPYWHDHWAGYWGGGPGVYWHGDSGYWHGGWHSRPEVSVHVHETVYEHGGYHHHH
jgi:hypothetical protein